MSDTDVNTKYTKFWVESQNTARANICLNSMENKKEKEATGGE